MFPSYKVPRAVDSEEVVLMYTRCFRAMCKRIEVEIPHGMDPLWAVVRGLTYAGLRPPRAQDGVINGIRYWWHGLGSMLQDRRHEIPGAIDIDLDLDFASVRRDRVKGEPIFMSQMGNHVRGYTFDFYRICDFVRSLKQDPPPRDETEAACSRLTKRRLLYVPPEGDKWHWWAIPR
jgi:hypothetical protein